MRGLHFAINKLTEAKRQKREAKREKLTLRLNPGGFVKKALENGKDKTMSTYWTYKGSLTSPGKFVVNHFPCFGINFFVIFIIAITSFVKENFYLHNNICNFETETT